ncbi:uncharacterized protein LOC121833438 [Ixodes scapularis]|uniref:uncharacterized protein LOC121833438 n=1 Tax=Ixodes scapularis TaxID=6945 RepID=UPI001C395527|nr:uncharacterized protein LOC121833438 [Ixodes scapularis]
MQQGEPSDPPPATVAAAAVRLPPYWDRNPRVWFLQAESQFHLAGVTTQGRKYHHVVSALSPAAADEVYDVLANPSPATPYDQLKNALLQRTEISERSRVQQLLSAEELGDRRPSQLLRRMTKLLGERSNNLDDVFLRELFLQRLPSNVQMVLATATTLDLTGLAALADAVMEVTTPSVANVTVAPQQPTALDSGSAANSQPPQANIEQLCQRLEEIVVAATRGRTPHPRESHRRRSTSRRARGESTSRRTRGENTRSPSPAGVCYYHRRFGANARHCLRPCSWQGNRPADL